MLRLLLAASVALHAAALSFHIEQATVSECGQTQVNFTAGSPPYQLTAIGAYSTAVNFTIPDDAVTDTGGSHSFTLPYPAGQEVVFVMSDATGFGAGGVSPLFKVGNAQDTTSCNLASEDPPFTFAVYPEGEVIPQCSDVSFTWEGPSSGPVFIFAVVPGGMMQVAAPRTGGRADFGPARFPVNTSVIYAAWDAAGQPGGTSSVKTIGGSASSSCMSGDVLSSTPVIWNPSATETGGPPQTSPTRGAVITVTSTALPAGAAGLTPGAIAGIVVGVIVAVLLLQALIVWFCCRRSLNSYLANRRAARDRKHDHDGAVDLYERRPEGEGFTSPTSRRDDAATIDPFLGGGESRPTTGWSQSQGSLVSASRVSYADSLGAPAAAPGQGQGQGYPPSLSGSGSGSGAGGRPPTKLQLAMANPDNQAVVREGPPMGAPVGGFRRHEDAGRVEADGGGEGEEQVEELPPTYDPQWEGGGGGGGGGDRR